MGRKEQAEARDMSRQAFNWQMGVSKEQLETQRQGRAETMPLVKGLVTDPGYSDAFKRQLGRVTANEGYSPEEISAQQQDTLGVTSSAFGKAREGLARHSAATRNTAGYAGAMGEMGREEAKVQAEQARRIRQGEADVRRQRTVENLGLTRSAEDEQQRREEQGINLMARLYGIDTGAFTSGRGEMNPAMESFRTAAYTPSPWFGVAQSAIGGGALVASKMV